MLALLAAEAGITEPRPAAISCQAGYIATAALGLEEKQSCAESCDAPVLVSIVHIEDLAQLQTRCLRDAEDALAVAEAARETAHRGDFTFLVDVVELSANRLGAAAAGGRSGVCRIATVGRTKAGKSTLRYVLTGQAENGIGIGGQRTTTSNLEYLWRDLEVVDTPGVGAFQGAEDAEVAAVAAAAADLVLWVVTSDGLQQATIRPVQDMLRRGVPLVVLINHKEVVDLTDLPRWTDAQLFEESDAHERRVRQVCRELGRSEVEVLHCHLDVAHLARNASDGSTRERSQLPQHRRLRSWTLRQLEAALVAAAARADAPRGTRRRRKCHQRPRRGAWRTSRVQATGCGGPHPVVGRCRASVQNRPRAALGCRK